MLNIPPMGSLHENTQELLVFLIWLQHCFPRSGGMERSEESHEIRRTQQKTCSGFLESLELLFHPFPSHSWHKESVPVPRSLCCSPWDPGFHTAQSDQSSVLGGWGSANIWNIWTKSMELCHFRPSAEPGSFLKHLLSPFPPKNYTVFDFIFPRSTSFSVYPLPKLHTGSNNVSSCPVQNAFQRCWGTEIRWFVAFPSWWWTPG